MVEEAEGRTKQSKHPPSTRSVRQALGIIARSQNVSELARRVGMSRDGLYKALSADGNPTWSDPKSHECTRPALRTAPGSIMTNRANRQPNRV